MTWTRILMACYGLMNLFMGIEAYVAKQSLPSLLGGGIAGLLILIFVALVPSRPRIAYIGTFVVCLALIGRFLPAYLKDTSNVYPALVIVTASIVVAAALLMAHVTASNRSKAAQGG